MDAHTDVTEDRLAELLRALPAPPPGWVEAARELPSALAGIDTLVERAEADAAERAAILAGLEEALAREGVEPTSGTVGLLRRRLAS
jgi:hypothetical protein